MDNDGLKEMLVRWDGCWIPGVYRIHDGEVLFSQIASKDTDTVTYISVNEHDERFFVVGEKTDSYEKLWIYDVKKNYAPGLLAYYEKCRASNDSTSPMDYYIMDVPVRRNIDHKYCRKYCEEDFYIDFKLNVGEEDSTIEWRKTNGIMSENEESKKSSESIDMENVIKSYEDYIKLNYNSAYGNVNISLLFIDDNDIPEAIIEQDGDIEWSIIGYDSENEKAVYLAGCTMNSLFYKPKGGCFYYDWSDGESNGSVYYKINGSNISECSEDELGNDVLKNCIYYDGLFFSNPAEAFKNLK